ncbi:MAG: hypothetical protein AAF722_07695 [Cyanobacteria bacterium P01_C01_bin.70]
MSQPSSASNLRHNPFWAYRDPHSGRWMTLMTAEQCQCAAKRVFTPQLRRDTNDTLTHMAHLRKSSSGTAKTPL